ncbi:hypothetical protein LRM35_21195 [Klebsiella variicola subsp. variicola]|nr:hypothetical protein LRM35_21195 [Klebsiella variicola subsp. variicola]
MGSVCDTVQEVVETLNAAGEKVGLLSVHLYRPFSLAHFFAQLPGSVQRIAVLDRTKEPGGAGGTAVPRRQERLLSTRRCAADRRRTLRARR